MALQSAAIREGVQTDLCIKEQEKQLLIMLSDENHPV